MALPVTDKNRQSLAEKLINRALAEKKGSITYRSPVDVDEFMDTVRACLDQEKATSPGYYLLKDIGPVFKGQGLDYNPNYVDTRVVLIFAKNWLVAWFRLVVVLADLHHP